MIKNKNAVDVWFQFEKENGREPTRDEFVDMGYYTTYYYTVKKKVKEIKREAIIKSVKVENETLIFK